MHAFPIETLSYNMQFASIRCHNLSYTCLRSIVFWQSPIVIQGISKKPHCHEMPLLNVDDHNFDLNSCGRLPKLEKWSKLWMENKSFPNNSRQSWVIGCFPARNQFWDLSIHTAWDSSSKTQNSAEIPMALSSGFPASNPTWPVWVFGIICITTHKIPHSIPPTLFQVVSPQGYSHDWIVWVVSSLGTQRKKIKDKERKWS